LVQRPLEEVLVEIIAELGLPVILESVVVEASRH
jgi:hypothetical protein